MPSPTPTFWRVAVAAVALGPSAMWLRESDWIDFSEAGMLVDIWFVALVALLGAGVAVLALRRRFWLVGGLGLVLNGGVAALYGFIGLFFGLGGSR